MKKTTLILFLFCTTFTIGQNIYNLEFFTQESPPFTLFINGIQQHSVPTTNIRIEGFIQPILKMRMEFSENMSAISKNLYMPDESSEISYQVKNTKKGLKVRVFSMVPIDQAPPISSRPDVMIVPYSTKPVISETTTTTISTGVTPGMNINVNNQNVGLNVSVNLGVGNGNVYQETTSTTTTTVGSSNNVYVMEGYNGNIGCDWPIDDANFAEALKTIKSKSFDDARVSIAKQIIQSNCMFSDQVRDLVSLISFDSSKLDLAKFAYGYTYDIGNYFKVSQALDFSSSVEELNDYISTFRW